MVYIGIDLGGTGIKIGVVDESGAILSQGETPTLAGRPYEDIIADMGRCMLDVMARGGFEEKDIASIGVGIPGVADEKTGHVIFCTNLGWSDVPLRTELQKYLNKPVYIDNDATVAGFAESICGVSAGCHSSVFMTLGTGVGGGIMGVVPGVMGVAAFAPPLDEAGNSVKAQKALAYIAGHLNLNIFGTTRCVMAEKEAAQA